jgi:hypothetical protein
LGTNEAALQTCSASTPAGAAIQTININVDLINEVVDLNVDFQDFGQQEQAHNITAMFDCPLVPGGIVSVRRVETSVDKQTTGDKTLNVTVPFSAIPNAALLNSCRELKLSMVSALRGNTQNNCKTILYGEAGGNATVTFLE